MKRNDPYRQLREEDKSYGEREGKGRKQAKERRDRYEE